MYQPALPPSLPLSSHQQNRQAMLLLLMLTAATAFALSDDERYDSGYDHGCSDANAEDHPYLDNSGGKSSHTAIFMQGYNDGYSECQDKDSKTNSDNGVSESHANNTDSEPGGKALLSKQNENTNSPSSPNSTSFHAIAFLKSHSKIFGLISFILGFSFVCAWPRCV